MTNHYADTVGSGAPKKNAAGGSRPRIPCGLETRSGIIARAVALINSRTWRVLFAAVSLLALQQAAAPAPVVAPVTQGAAA
jgi:hypothetical protein